MIGAGSVVTRDVGPHELVAGNPARRVGYVCSCGRRLVREGTAATFRCSVCGRTVELPGADA
jgi:UDP-2-acetamido-3-amino-2,3-dideoxy-glucuronate N-acetyltransferase